MSNETPSRTHCSLLITLALLLATPVVMKAISVAKSGNSNVESCSDAMFPDAGERFALSNC